jgi:hypothetical protein
VALVIDADRARRLGLESVPEDQAAALARWLSHAAGALPAVAADYPAAHSMDTTFFAVDANGHVAVFFSGEDGPVPSASQSEDSLFSVLRQLGGEPEPDEEDDDFDWDEAEEEAIDRGLYLYEYVGEFNPLLLPYSLTGVPEQPLHADQLPPKVRRLFQEVRFDKIAFADTERLQIVEHVRCFFYSDEDAAYVAGDDKTVRPIPGREKKYRPWCLDFRNSTARVVPAPN